jgi:hypothetical protein
MNNATALKDNIFLFVGPESDFYDTSLNYCTQPNIFICYLRGNKSINLSTFFDEFSATLQFPYYFGENWSAFDECLNDWRLSDKKKIMLFISNTQEILREEDESQYKIFINILANATLEWNSKGISFQVVFHCMNQHIEVVHKKLSCVSNYLLND